MILLGEFFTRLNELINNFFARQKRKNKAKSGDNNEPNQEDLGLGAEMGSQSMLEGDHGKIFGLSRTVIKGIALALFVLFSVALIFATSGDEAKKEKSAESTATANDKLNDKEFPNDYEKLGEFNKRNQPAQVPQSATGGKYGKNESPQQPAKVEVQQQVPVQKQQLPVIPSVPTYTPPAPVVQQAKASEPAAPAPQVKQNDAYNSAIAFMGGNNGIGNDNGNDASGTSASIDVSSSIVEPTDDMLIAGTVIPAMLMTGIDTALEGQVKIQILSDVTNVSGSRILIPAGSFALGTYNASGAGSRVGLTLTTLILPSGATAEIGDNFVAVDGAGYTGLKGKPHHHTGEKIFNGLLSSGLTALATAGAKRAYIDASAISGLIDSGNIKNTATVPPGYQFSLYVTKNIIL